MSECNVCGEAIEEKYARYGTCFKHSSMGKSVADVIAGPPLSEKEQYWKKYEKTLVRMAHDMNTAFNANDVPAAVKIPSNADEGWYIKERHERYLQSRVDVPVD